MTREDAVNKLDELVENVWLRLFTRLGLPALVAIGGWMTTSQLSTLADNVKVVEQLRSGQDLMNYKIDQLTQQQKSIEEIKKDLNGVVFQVKSDSARIDRLEQRGGK